MAEGSAIHGHVDDTRESNRARERSGVMRLKSPYQGVEKGSMVRTCHARGLRDSFDQAVTLRGHREACAGALIQRLPSRLTGGHRLRVDHHTHRSRVTGSDVEDRLDCCPKGFLRTSRDVAEPACVLDGRIRSIPDRDSGRSSRRRRGRLVWVVRFEPLGLREAMARREVPAAASRKAKDARRSVQRRIPITHQSPG